MSLAQTIAQLMAARRQTLATAESCTGGLLSHQLTNVPGSSSFFVSGIIAYSNETKKNILRVPAATLSRHGAVSFEVASAMAKNVRRLFKTDYGIGISGIAGPTGGTAQKPVGLVYIAVSSRHECLCLECRFSGTRTRVKAQAAAQALRLLKTVLQSS